MDCIVHGVAKSQTGLSDFHKAMATHSSILAWRIPGTGKPGGLDTTERVSTAQSILLSRHPQCATRKARSKPWHSCCNALLGFMGKLLVDTQ